MPRTEELPGWPRLLRLKQAAAYTGRSPKLFEDEVKLGRWPKPQQKGLGMRRISKVWDRQQLDAAIDRASNGGTPRSVDDVILEMTRGPENFTKGRSAPHKTPRR